MLKSLRVWAAPLTLTATAVIVVLMSPLASPNEAAAGPIISGARSVSDQLSVNFSTLPKGHTTTDVHLLAFNDLHGNLEAAGLNVYGKFAGGAAYLAKAVKDRQALYGSRQATLFAGDNIGAAPLQNGLFHEEPIVLASNMMNVDFASVGNHEFDKGSTELLRIQNGGCHPDGCNAAPYRLPDGSTTDVYPGADFQYLSANVIVNSTGQPLFPAYGIKRFTSDDGKRKFKVGFIGEVLESTPTIVTPTGVAGLTFEDEAEAANRAAAELALKGVKVPVLVIHQGGFQSAGATLNGCAGNLAGSDIAEIAGRLDPAIKIIVSAHTHAEYRCTFTMNGVTRLITSASSFGRVLSDITLTIDEKSDKLISADATNVIVENALNSPGPGVVRQADTSKEDPQVAAVVQQYVTAAAPLANHVIGRIQGDLTRTSSPQGESTLGDVIADAQYVATHPDSLGGAALALMNPGGIRLDMRTTDISSGGEALGEVTYGEAFAVQPFGNSLVTKTMTGAAIRHVLEQQFRVPNTSAGIPCRGSTAPVGGRVLQVSSTFKYESDPNALTCDGKIGRMWVNGVEVQPTDVFRVTMNNFLATGGDGFTVFRDEATDALGGAQDIDALVDYFGENEPGGIAVPTLDRIVAKP